MQTTTEPIIRTYPTISQSLEIAGILIIAKVLVSLANFRLGDILGEETTMLLYYVLSIGIPFWVINTIRKKITGESSFVLTVNNPRIIPLIIVVTLALLFGIISPLGSLIPIPDSFKEAFRTMAGQTGILSFILIVIVAPVFEELIFRGIMLDGLLKKYTPMRSIMISSLLFGFVHLNPWQFIAGFIRKCTTPVRAIAISIGKKMANTGVRIVPSPNPEKKVSREVIRAAIQRTRISIQIDLWHNCGSPKFGLQSHHTTSTKAITEALTNVVSFYFSQLHFTALAEINSAGFAFKDRLTSRTYFFFVLYHTRDNKMTFQYRPLEIKQ